MLHAYFPNSPPASDKVFLQIDLAIRGEEKKKSRREKQKKEVSFGQTLIAVQKPDKEQGKDPARINSRQASSILALGRMIKPQQLQTSSHSAACYCPSGEAKPASKKALNYGY